MVCSATLRVCWCLLTEARAGRLERVESLDLLEYPIHSLEVLFVTSASRRMDRHRKLVKSGTSLGFRLEMIASDVGATGL